ncbi:hypothetical protein HUT13_25945 [Streptomyces harbinensis]|nr:hypothetical protein [Streptomyces harbinensis]QKV72383.1 hypothetical protein HUT13_25945 [Streptomyces harbinensis]
MAAFVARAEADPAVVGLVLSGSRAHDGMATGRSDYDVHVITRDHPHAAVRELDGFRSGHLDLVVMSLADFRIRGLPGDPQGWQRYAYVHARVLLDRLDGTIARILDRKRTLDRAEARNAVDSCLDAYVNQTFRSLKSHRDGRATAGHLDAAESVPLVLEVLFALHQRVRPYNKYLRWELTRYPLGDPRWDAERLLPTLGRILTDGDPDTQRSLFTAVEAAARRAGHGPVLDSWGSDLRLLRSRN